MIRYCFIFIVVVCLALSGCQAPSRYSQAKDSAPSSSYPEPAMEDVTPRYEPYRETNSRPYEVFGKHYKPLTSGKGYTAVGNASWYGQKFHGHLTSNGEIYDMFGMSAAHKTLPLPSYVKVTNLSNQLSAIVRVNDRGPFHSDRIIDLSYAAAKKLDFHKNGTTAVKLEVIHVDSNDMVSVGKAPAVPYALYAGELPSQQALHDADAEVAAQSAPQESNAGQSADSGLTDAGQPGYYIQVAALSDADKAKQLSSGLSSLYQVPVEIPLINQVYRLRLGPLTDRFKLDMLLDALRQNGYPGAYKVAVN
ncbi:septal ring lytic transglycosylase RlpA family protein [Alteromonas gilva]|uniref:Endolytic peptidoglycan transglycosylase RlpA n=1 Tax=Alteromonas gilva TaxID=2987522 RepID=A0ABT5L1Y9_9ALTE|nr:septal ring lytic transglycosylase RlpA family protein [Alteromonas gilva]MDC8830893.1 septal ring lytic transglycosylase RlpA family protein [Alteromonas gilva]